MGVSAILGWNRCDIPRRVTVRSPTRRRLCPSSPPQNRRYTPRAHQACAGRRSRHIAPPPRLLSLALRSSFSLSLSLFPSFLLSSFLRLRGSSLGTHNSGFWPHNRVMRGLCADCARPPAHSEHKCTGHVRIHDATAQQLKIAHSCTIRAPISSKSPAHNSRFQQEYRVMHGGCDAASH